MAAAERDRFTSPVIAAARFVAQRMILKPVVWTVTKVTVLGKTELTDLKGAFVVVANHTSHLDAPLIFGALPRRLARYLAAGAAADYFFDVRWRRGLTALFFNAFAVDRSGVGPRGVSAKSLLRRGIPLIVFPEGTRSRDGSLGTFKPGAAALAAGAEVPCVPVAIIGASIAHPRGSKWPGPGRLPVGVVFGEPMHAEPGEAPTAYITRVRAEVARLTDEHSARILAQGPTHGQADRPSGDSAGSAESGQGQR
ncbi:1-acyl-sn-glycerol-3-phosphate acyltransferase [Naasia lichenicola]|uniref:1-acyl-sn-glycerol-3-phosphate acyltransferase n=2 Tax=Naasia lichenicola TaxID=2565933 RepID=A0A4S4FQ30_9MICO|nr:1-acyl-sn-glycerol-3-phosphate acyltransferase [Naasia lichenicola]